MDSLHLAKKICQKLKEAGYIAYFAGGFIRDKLLGIASDDIDIATDATPEEIAALFPKHLLIGAQFGVVAVVLENHTFEVATFRNDLKYEDGRKPSAIQLKSSPIEDAKRRDFTINGLFYDPFTDEILDYVDGKRDIQAKVIRTIGDPKSRFSEDRLRIIRAVRFATKFGFTIDKKTEEAILHFSSTLLPAVSMERIFQELTKMRMGDSFYEALSELYRLQLLQAIFPPLKNHDLTEKLEACRHFSKNVPMILFLSHLLFGTDASFEKNLAIYLKASNEQAALIECYHAIKTFDFFSAAPYSLAQLLANPSFEKAFEASCPSKELLSFVEEQKRNLAFFIDLFKRRESIITAADLQALGIQPGKEMGELLKKSQQLAVNLQIQEKEKLLEALQREIKRA
jgi:poly(A) polymerase